MMVQNNEIWQLKITNIRLNLQNPRYDPTSSEQEAIGTIVRKQGRKLVRLAADIVEKDDYLTFVLKIVGDSQ
jgi:hypothetical protein